MTNCSSFELINTGNGYYFVVGSWLSNFCHGTFSSKMESLRKKWRSFENRGRNVRKKGRQGTKKASCYFFFILKPIGRLWFFF